MTIMGIILFSHTLCGLLLFTNIVNAETKDPVVQTSYGKVQGVTTLHSSPHVTTFLGIPYAKPPLKELRFLKPQKPDKWGGILDATKYSSMCHSTWTLDKYHIYNIFGDPQAETVQSEDCLTLNIYYPGNFELRMNHLKPVMVFIHGGGYFMGGANLYDGNIFVSTQNIIMVAINYRLSFFGFSSTNDSLIPGNMGLLDQVSALIWIQENIKAFGGDSSKITIVGESAGADSVVNHIVSPMSRGLFQRVIIQSEFNYYKPTKEQQSEQIAYIAKVYWGCDDDDEKDSKQFLKCLQNVPEEKIVGVDASDAVFSSHMMSASIIDGLFLPEDPFEMLGKGMFDHSIEVIIGYNGHDGRGMINYLNPDVVDNLYSSGIESTQVALNAVKTAWPFFFREDINHSPKGNEMLELIEKEYFNHTADPLALGQSLINLYTDCAFGARSIAIADAIIKYGGCVYLYQFNHQSDKYTMQSTSQSNSNIKLLAGHYEDMFYTFGKPLVDADDDDNHLVSLSMMGSWASFAKTGKPSYLTRHMELALWKPYQGADKRYFIINSELDEMSGKRVVSERILRMARLWSLTIPMLSTGNKPKTFHFEL